MIFNTSLPGEWTSSGKVPGCALIQGRMGLLFPLVALGVMTRAAKPLPRRREETGNTEDEMIGWHHRLDGHEFKQAPEVGEGQGSLACCSPWGHKESDTS